MDAESLFALCLFALVMSVTPGPNNLMLMASGMNFGFRASVPHMLGVSIGFVTMVIAVGVGLAQIIALHPTAYTVMKWLGAGYLLYLAWCIATTNSPTGERAQDKIRTPMTFIGAAAFQWVNPKAWAMAAGAFSAYVPAPAGIGLIAGVAALFAVINAPCIAAWAYFGSGMRRLLHVARRRRVFNVCMALLLVVSLVPMLNIG